MKYHSHDRRRQRVSLVFLLLVLAALVLAGCGGSEATSPQEAPPDPQEHLEGASHEDHDGEEGEGARAVELTRDQVASLGIRLDTLEAGSAASVLNRPASVRFDPDRVALVGPRIEGKIVRVSKDLGERVARGETIAILTSAVLGTAKSQYLTAKAHLNTARRAYGREQQLRSDSISSEADLLEAQARFEEAQAEVQAALETLRLYGVTEAEVDSGDLHDEPLSHFHLTSPIAGFLQKRDASPGQTVVPQETPFHVADPSRMWVMIDGFERDVPVVRAGQRVTLSVRSLPGQTFDGQVDFVAHHLNADTRTLRLRAIVRNRDLLLRDGMYGQARVYTDAPVERALIPTDAVQTVGAEPVVFVPGEADGHFCAVPVQLGEESQDGVVELLAGLQPGAVAVTDGAFDLKAALTATTRSAAHSH